MERRGVTYDEVYEIAGEVAEEVVTKFLKNLVKLVPSSKEIVDDIREEQYNELQRLRRNKHKRVAEDYDDYEDPEDYSSHLEESAPMSRRAQERKAREDAAKANAPKRKPFNEDVLGDNELDNDDFAAIAHPGKLQESKMNIDDALMNIPLEATDLFGEAASSPVDNDSVVPM